MSARILRSLSIATLLFSLPCLAQWKQLGNLGAGQVDFLAFDDSVIYAGRGVGAFHADLSGKEWVEYAGKSYAVAAWKGTVYSLDYHVLNRSGDRGRTWTKVPSFQLSAGVYFAVAVSDSSLFIGTNIYGGEKLDSGGVYRTDDSGRTWRLVGLKRRIIQHLAVSGRALCAISTDSEYGNRSLQCSQDNGETWTKLAVPDSEAITGIAFAESRLFACIWKNGLAYTDDMGVTWKRAGFEGRNISAIAGHGGKIAIANDEGILLSSDKGGNWEKHSEGPDNTLVRSFAVSQGSLFAGNESGIFRLEEDGLSWKKSLPDSFGFADVAVVKSMENDIYACGSFVDVDRRFQVLKSRDGGNSWTRFYDMASGYLSGIIESGSNILLSTSQGLLRSADSGKTWAGPDTSIQPKYGELYLASHGPAFFAAHDSVVFVSSDFGKTWSRSLRIDPKKGISLLTFADSVLICGIRSGIYYSRDRGASWDSILTGMQNWDVIDVVLDAGRLIAVSNDGSGTLYHAALGGNRWANLALNTGFEIRALRIHEGNLYAGLGFHGARSLPLSRLPPLGIRKSVRPGDGVRNRALHMRIQAAEVNIPWNNRIFRINGAEDQISPSPRFPASPPPR